LARKSNPTADLAGEVDIISEERVGVRLFNNIMELCLIMEQEHTSASSGKLAKASEQHVKGDGQRGK
jgi:hypothetical protein